MCTCTDILSLSKAEITLLIKFKCYGRPLWKKLAHIGNWASQGLNAPTEIFLSGKSSAATFQKDFGRSKKNGFVYGKKSQTDQKPLKRKQTKTHTQTTTTKPNKKNPPGRYYFRQQRLISYFTQLFSTNAVEVLWTEALQSSEIPPLKHWHLVLVKWWI